MFSINRFGSKLGDPRTSGIKTSRVQDFESIKQQCLTGGFLFEDRLFSPLNTKQSECVWLRPHEISQDPKFISGGVSRFDVVQGELGDCWLVAAVANLTLNQRLFSLVVPPEQSFDRGSYCGLFRFRFWQFGKWIEVVVDDRLPTKNGKLMFLHSSDPDEFWSPLLEKAYAKLHGDFDALRGGTTCEAMVDLTGGITEFYDINTAETPENLYSIIKKGYERGSLIGCSIEISEESQLESELPNGLIRGHAYSITAVIELKPSSHYGGGLQLLRLRNPWSGTSEWNGAWSDQSREWFVLSDQEKRQMGLVVAADGEFWMSYADFKQNFTRVEICNLSPDTVDSSDDFKSWYAQMFEGAWIRGQTAGGCRNNIDTFAYNPQFIINLTDPDENDDDNLCTIIVALMQKNRREVKRYQMGSKELTIGFAIYALKDGVPLRDPSGASAPQYRQQLLNTDFFKYNASVARSPTYINLREVSARFRLEPGPYVIIPSTFDKNEEGEFILRVWTEAPFSTGQVPGITPSAHHVMPAPSDGNFDNRSKQPIYPPYPTDGGENSIDNSRPSYPPYPTNPRDNDVNYPTLPDEPEISRRRVEPPPPGPKIDISIGEVAGFIAGVISLISVCYNNYKQMSGQPRRTYPYQGPAPGNQV